MLLQPVSLRFLGLSHAHVEPLNVEAYVLARVGDGIYVLNCLLLATNSASKLLDLFHLLGLKLAAFYTLHGLESLGHSSIKQDSSRSMKRALDAWCLYKLVVAC